MLPLLAQLSFARRGGAVPIYVDSGLLDHKFAPIRGDPALMLLRGRFDTEMMSIQWQADPPTTAP
jgi:hypothetical protein